MELSLFQYRLPFKRPFTTGTDSFSAREGLFLQLNHQGIQAVGEAAPLPGFSHESLTEVLDFTADHSPEIKSFIGEQIASGEPDWQSFAPEPPPSLVFAIDTLVADYHARQQQCSLQDLLFDRFSPELAVNATLPIDTVKKSLITAKDLWQRGYRTLKLKVGKNFDHERALIQHIRQQLPNVFLRIDANQSWNVEEAIGNLQALEQYDIEYCEEPISDPTPTTLRQLGGSTDIPIAVDESVSRQPDPRQWITENVGDVLIVKPMIIGSLSKIFETCRLADHHDYTVVFTSTLESGIGRWMTAVLASGLGSRETAHGLATGHLLAMDVWKDQTYIKEGAMSLPGGPGLTVNLLSIKSGSALTKLDVF